MILPKLTSALYQFFGGRSTAPAWRAGAEEGQMKKREFTEEEKIAAIRQMEAGRPAAEVGRELGVSKHAVYAWKAKYRGMDANEARRLRQLEEENRRLKALVANLSLDKEVLKAVIEKNGWSS